MKLLKEKCQISLQRPLGRDKMEINKGNKVLWHIPMIPQDI